MIRYPLLFASTLLTSTAALAGPDPAQLHEACIVHPLSTLCTFEREGDLTTVHSETSGNWTTVVFRHLPAPAIIPAALTDCPPRNRRLFGTCLPWFADRPRPTNSDDTVRDAVAERTAREPSVSEPESDCPNA